MCQVQHEETASRGNVMQVTLVLRRSILKYTKPMNKAASYPSWQADTTKWCKQVISKV